VAINATQKDQHAGIVVNELVCDEVDRLFSFCCVYSRAVFTWQMRIWT